MRRRAALSLFVVPVLLACAPGASAAQRWATATGGLTSGACTSVTPCTISHAVNAAAPNDEVIVEPGTHTVTTGLLATNAIVLRGVVGPQRPRLVGAANLAAPTLDVRSSTVVSDLSIEATNAAQPAVSAYGALLERVVVRSAGTGAVLAGDPGTTVLRDSVVVADGTASTNAGVVLVDRSGTSPDVAVINATVYASAGSAAGIRCEMQTGVGLLYNTIARGGGADVKPGAGGGTCGGQQVNVRSGAFSGLTATGLQNAEPAFSDVAALDFRPLAGSPTIDAGVMVQGVSTTDLAGGARTYGAAPDIGAFEYTPSTTSAPAAPNPAAENPAGVPASAPGASLATDPDATPATSTPAEALPPQLGRSVVLDAGPGTVKVRLPGRSAFTALAAVANLPVGTVVDTRLGEVTLSTALPNGKVQTGTFGGGVFEVRQGKGSGGMTDIVLRGGSFAACAPAAKRRAVAARAAMAGKRGKRSSNRRRIRRLWASDKGGRFRTHGRDSVATVRGTRWLTEDRCDGTLTRVVEGAVDVRDVRRGTVTRVRAGRSVLVPHARRR